VKSPVDTLDRRASVSQGGGRSTAVPVQREQQNTDEEIVEQPIGDRRDVEFRQSEQGCADDEREGVFCTPTSTVTAIRWPCSSRVSSAIR